jgi:HicB family
MTTPQSLLREARRLAGTTQSWADLSNALFSPVDGLLTSAYRSREARRRFMQTPEYAQIQRLLADAINKFGLVEGATPKKSGRFVVRLPRSLHAALEREADREGVSLNQLVVAKLAAQLNTLAAGTH